jgi:serine/threonine protein kinase/tetratricopeptide (TPR) repeat protein
MPHPENPVIFSCRYQVLQDLCEGGIGRVYRSLDQWTGKDVALKVLSAGMANLPLLESFKREFLLLNRLRHPGIVEVYDFGYLSSFDSVAIPLPYFTMEFVEGKSLSESFPGLPNSFVSGDETERFGSLIMQICDILEFIHLRGLVHCDLKPDNLKITDHIFQPKILDFGLAEKIGSKRIKETKGTLPYMAPEMFKEEPLDARTDLYSLGVILFELVTSKLPFPSDDPVKIVSAHLQEKPASPSEINPNIPSSLNELILRLLEKSPADRPSDAHQVKKMLEKGFSIYRNEGKKTGYPSVQNLISHVYSGPMVGRETESRWLEEHLKKATATEGGFVLISGEQGIGKSLLLHQLKIACQLQGITVMDTCCQQDQTAAYQPLIDICSKVQLYVENQCSPSVIQNLKDILHRFKEGSHRSPDESPEGEASDMAKAVSGLHRSISEVFTEISAVLPLVIMIDDLQWVDVYTLQFLEFCRCQCKPNKIIWCLSFREEPLTQEPFLQTLLTHANAKEKTDLIKLSRFDLDGTRNLILSKFPVNQFPSEFSSFVHERTAGNPHFVVEVLKYLLEKNVVSLQDSSWLVDLNGLKKTNIPDSIESVLTENLKRYDAQILDLLGIASVIGKRFSLDMIGELNPFDRGKTSEILTMLTDQQMLIRKDDPVDGERYYEFANQSVQAILYRRLKEKERLLWHKKIGELLERRTEDERDDSVFDIAHHYSEAGENSKAYHFSLLSAEKMEQRYANQEVLAYFDKAIKLTSEFPDDQKAIENRVRALNKRADFCKKVGELNQAEEDYQAVLKLVETSSDLKMQVKVYNNLAEIYRLKHEYSKGISILQKAMQIHEKIDDSVERANTLSYLGLLYWTDSQYQNALDSFHKALDIDQKQEGRSYRASTLNNMGLVYWSLHQYSEALRHFTEALSIYVELDNQEWIARTHNNIGATFLFLGEFPQALDHLLKSLDLNEKLTNQKEAAYNLENIGEVYRKMGDYTNAFKYWERELNLSLEINFTQRAGYAYLNSGISYFDLGNYQKSFEYFQQAKDIAERIEDKELRIQLLINLSRYFAVLNDYIKSYQVLEEAVQIAHSINDEKSLINIYQIKGHLARKNGQTEKASELLNQAGEIADKLNAKEDAFLINLELSELCLEKGEEGKAREFLENTKNSGLERYILFQPYYYFISGKLEYTSGNTSRALKDFEDALHLAEKLNHLEIVWRIRHQSGKLFLSTHDIVRAYHELQSGGKILKRLVDSIEDEELKRNYSNDQDKKKMLADLKRTAKELIGETKLSQ